MVLLDSHEPSSINYEREPGLRAIKEVCVRIFKILHAAFSTFGWEGPICPTLANLSFLPLSSKRAPALCSLLSSSFLLEAVMFVSSLFEVTGLLWGT